MKLASRCNLACTYCYWFRDDAVYSKPPVLLEEAETAFLEKLEAHVKTYELDYFGILFHGGEPMLLGQHRFSNLTSKLRSLEQRLNMRLDLAITTNATLIDRAWARKFREHQVKVGVSLDGPREVHDSRRIDFRNRGTFDRVVASIDLLREEGVEPSILAVADPLSDPQAVVQAFLETIGVNTFDLLVPDATHEDNPTSIAAFYRKLFDLWYDSPEDERINVRFIESVAKGLLGIPSRSESIGAGPITTLTMLTDGSLEPLDVLRTARFNITRTDLNIQTHTLQDIQQNPLWREVRDASIHPAKECQECPYRFACGGGHIASRWSRERRYDNPSVYCSDFKQIFSHAWRRMAPDLYVETPNSRIPLRHS
ncbi:radical SAM protein [Streptomyces coeruleorubidus]|uniref:radical SAM protein n=1 Tax=Streptomyces coeruleorubidus TaxID=116188 RepID=UPI0033D99743